MERNWKEIFEAKLMEKTSFNSPDYLIKKLPRNTFYNIRLSTNIEIVNNNGVFKVDMENITRYKKSGDILTFEYENKNLYGSKQYLLIEYFDGTIKEYECGLRDKFNIYFDDLYTYVLRNYVELEAVQNNFAKISYSIESISKTYFKTQESIYEEIIFPKENIYTKETNLINYLDANYNIEIMEMFNIYYDDNNLKVKVGDLGDLVITNNKDIFEKLNYLDSEYKIISDIDLDTIDNSIINDIISKDLYFKNILETIDYSTLTAGDYKIDVDFDGNLKELEIFLKLQIKNSSKLFSNSLIDKIFDVYTFDNTEFVYRRYVDDDLRVMVNNLGIYYLFKDYILDKFKLLKPDYKSPFRTKIYKRILGEKYEYVQKSFPSENIIVTTNKELLEQNEINVFTFTESLIKSVNDSLHVYDVNTNNNVYLDYVISNDLSGLEKIIDDIKVETLPTYSEMKGTYNDLELIKRSFSKLNLLFVDGNESYTKELNYFFNSSPDDYYDKIEEFLLNKNVYDKFSDDLKFFVRLSGNSKRIFETDVMIGERTYYNDMSGIYFINDYNYDLHKINFNMNVKYFDNLYSRRFDIFHDLDIIKDSYNEINKYFDSFSTNELKIINDPNIKIDNSYSSYIPGDLSEETSNALITDEYDDCYVHISSEVNLDDNELEYMQNFKDLKDLLLQRMPYYLKYNYKESRLLLTDYYRINGDNFNKIDFETYDKHLFYKEYYEIDQETNDYYDREIYTSENTYFQTEFSPFENYKLDENIKESFELQIDKKIIPFIDKTDSVELNKEAIYVGGNSMCYKTGEVLYKFVLNNNENCLSGRGTTVTYADSYRNIKVGRDVLTLNGDYMQEVRVRKFTYRDNSGNMNSDTIFGIRYEALQKNKVFYFSDDGIKYIEGTEDFIYSSDNEEEMLKVLKNEGTGDYGVSGEFIKVNKSEIEISDNKVTYEGQDYIIDFKENEDIYGGKTTEEIILRKFYTKEKYV
jgi:hypothetical protein